MIKNILYTPLHTLHYIKYVVICIFTFYSCASAVAQTPAQRQVPKSFSTITYTPGLNIGYYEYLPENYSIGANYPVVIFLHGVGEKGNGTTDLARVKVNGPPKMIDNGTNFGFICITPQTNWPHDWKPEYVDEIIEMVKTQYKVDANRIYLTGLSMGGAGTFDYAGYSKTNANKLAAIVPMAGWLSQTACNMNTLPIWGFQGGNDGSGTINAINGIKSCNPAPLPTPLITVYPNVGHNCWDLAYSDQKMWDWLLSQKKSSSIPINISPIVNAGADLSLTLPANSADITATASDADGLISKYKWTQISGTNNTLSKDTLAKLSLTNLSVGNYVFRINVTDNKGAVAYDEISISVQNPIPVVVEGTGLTGNYYNNITLKDSATTTKTDAIINFTWGSGGPSVTGVNQFSVRWTGQVQTLYSETYKFYTHSDDRVKLWVNDQLIINNWMDHGLKEDIGTINLQANTKYNIKIEYCEIWGDATIKLFWSSPSQIKEIIPTKYLFASLGTNNTISPKDVILSANSKVDLITVDTYPNPTQEQVSINFNAPNASVLNINWINSEGRNCNSYIKDGNAGKNEIVLPTQNLKNGIYLLKINGDGISFSKKITILK